MFLKYKSNFQESVKFSETSDKARWKEMIMTVVLSLNQNLLYRVHTTKTYLYLQLMFLPSYR